MNFKKELGKKIKEVRESKGIKAKFVAEQIGLSVTQYSLIENGKAGLTTERLNDISQVLGVSFFSFQLSETLNNEQTAASDDRKSA